MTEQSVRQLKIGPGDRFGKLTVLFDSGEREYGSILWNCQCDCGNLVKACTRVLRAGRKQDCGRCETPALIGQRFGQLTVVEDLGTIEGGKDHLWNCQCDCGNLVKVTQSRLKQGLRKSCGCLHDTVYIDNLKLCEGTSVNKLQNGQKMNVSNTSGYNGVYPHKSHGHKTGKWVAQIGFQGRKIYLGAYATKEEAAWVREEGEAFYYGRFMAWYDAGCPGKFEVNKADFDPRPYEGEHDRVHSEHSSRSHGGGGHSGGMARTVASPSP